MVFTHAEEINAHLIGQHTLGDDVAYDLRIRQQGAGRIRGHVAERVQTKFHGVVHFTVCCY